MIRGCCCSTSPPTVSTRPAATRCSPSCSAPAPSSAWQSWWPRTCSANSNASATTSSSSTPVSCAPPTPSPPTPAPSNCSPSRSTVASRPATRSPPDSPTSTSRRTPTGGRSSLRCRWKTPRPFTTPCAMRLPTSALPSCASNNAGTASPTCSARRLPPTHRSGPVSETSGVIYDIGYQGYDGPRLGRRHAVLALYVHGLRGVFGLGRPAKSRVLPWLVVAIMFIPIVVLIAVMSRTGTQVERYDFYPFQLQAPLAVFLAAQAPELLSRDQR